jgi:acetyl esterase/lipase
MKRIALTFTLLILAFASTKAVAQTPDIVTTKNVVYESWDGASLLMDVDMPTNQGPGPFPAIICIHGGGWTTGGRGAVEGSKEASRGYVIVRIDYRLADTWRFPENVRDVKVAVRFVKKNADFFHIDPTRIGLFGYSAGAQLASLAGVSFGDAYLETAKGNHDFDSSVKSIVAVSGPTDLAQVEDHAPAQCAPIDTDDPNSIYYNLFGVPLSTIPETVQLANPVNYLSADDPPIFLVHGAEDCVVPYYQSQLLFDAYQAQGLDATLYTLSPKGHTVSIYSQAALITAL